MLSLRSPLYRASTFNKINPSKVVNQMENGKYLQYLLKGLFTYEFRLKRVREYERSLTDTVLNHVYVLEFFEGFSIWNDRSASYANIP